MTLTASEGEPAQIRLRIGDDVWTAATVIGVPRDSVESLEIVGAQTVIIRTDEPTGPAAARAVVRDSEGELVFGAPVAWRVQQGLVSLTGPEARGPDFSVFGVRSPPLPGPDYVYIDDDCLPPSKRIGRREVSLSASYRDLRDEVTFAWTHDPGGTPSEWAAADARFEPGPQCPPNDAGCSCASVPGGSTRASGTIPFACALALLYRRRRRARRRRRRPRASTGSPPRRERTRRRRGSRPPPAPRACRTSGSRSPRRARRGGWRRRAASRRTAGSPRPCRGSTWSTSRRRPG